MFRTLILDPVRLLIFYLLAVVFACLWPFNFWQSNLVSWNPGSGLHFNEPSTVYSTGPLTKLQGLKQFTLLLHLSSRLPDEASWIVSYGLDLEQFGFMLGQRWGQLVFELKSNDPQKRARLFVESPFDNSGRAWIAVTYDGTRLTAFSNGEKKRENIAPAVDPVNWKEDFPLVFGSGTNGKFAWTGTMYGFALLNRAASPEELMKPESLFAAPAPLLRYSFREGSGFTIFDSGVPPSHTLVIPRKFSPYVRPTLMSPVSYWFPRPLLSDVILNIVGYIPLGILLASLYAPGQRMKMWMIIVLSSLALSVGLEVAQSFLSSRWSSVSDVLANTAGGILGAVLWQSKLFQKLIEMGGFHFQRNAKG